jgi:hypothetical protein
MDRPTTNATENSDGYLEQHFAGLAGENLKRFRDSVDIMVGRKKRFDSQSLLYHYPNLAPIEFFDRAEFPWLDPIEAATDEIRDEFLAILAAEEGFTPYITYPADVPHNQFAELNNSPRWSAFHIYKMGELIEENAAKCPRTMSSLQGAPQPDQPGRTPSAMFSLLKPKTRIPPHTGVTCARHARPALSFPKAADSGRKRPGNGFRAGRGCSTTRSSTRPERQRQAPSRAHLRHLAPAADAARAGDDHGADRRHECLYGRSLRAGHLEKKTASRGSPSSLPGPGPEIRTSRSR